MCLFLFLRRRLLAGTWPSTGVPQASGVADVLPVLASFTRNPRQRGVACTIELDDAGEEFHAAGNIEREDEEYSLFLANAFTS